MADDKKPQIPTPPASTVQHDRAKAKEGSDLSAQLATERSGDAQPDPALHDVHAQNREQQRLSGEAKSVKGNTVRIKTHGGKAMELTEERWNAERQTLGQAGYELDYLVDAQIAADAKASE